MSGPMERVHAFIQFQKGSVSPPNNRSRQCIGCLQNAMSPTLLQSLDDKISASLHWRHRFEHQTDLNSNPVPILRCWCDSAFVSSFVDMESYMRTDNEIHICVIGRANEIARWLRREGAEDGTLGSIRIDPLSHRVYVYFNLLKRTKKVFSAC